MPSQACCEGLRYEAPVDSRVRLHRPQPVLPAPDQELFLSRDGHCHPACVFFSSTRSYRPRTSVSTVRPHCGPPRPVLRAPRRPSVSGARTLSSCQATHRCSGFSSTGPLVQSLGAWQAFVAFGQAFRASHPPALTQPAGECV